jgi:TPR repeat protein
MADSGDAFAQVEYGQAYRRTRAPCIPHEFQMASAQNHPSGHIALGEMLDQEQACPAPNLTAALSATGRLQSTIPEGMDGYAQALHSVLGVPRNEALASEWHKRAADRGHVMVQCILRRNA